MMRMMIDADATRTHRLDLAAFLTHERETLARAWADLLRQIPESHYRDTPPERVQTWMARRLDAISEALTSSSFDVLDTRLARVALLQLERGFTIDEVLNGLLLAKEAVLPVIWDHASGDAALVRRWTAQLDACLRHAVSRFGAQFAAISMQQIRAHEQRTALMLEAAQTASSSLEIDQVLARIATSMAAAVGARDCGIYLLDTARNSLVLHACEQYPWQAAPGQSHPGRAVRAARGAGRTRRVPRINLSPSQCSTTNVVECIRSTWTGPPVGRFFLWSQPHRAIQ